MSENRLLRRCGFTRFELVVAIIILCLLFGIILTKFLSLQVDVERTAMAENVGAMRSAVALQTLAYIAKGNTAGATAMIGTNPMRYISQAPANYVGQRAHPDPAKIPGGHWYFDLSDKELVYRAEHWRFFQTPLKGPARALFKIVPIFQDLNRDGKFEPGIDELEGVLLKAVEPYRWLRGPM